MASIRLKNIFKKYPGGVIAVNDLSLDVEDKEFLVLVGPSGCGKTTTLRMLAGLEDITEGEVYIDDKLVNEVAPKDRDIAMVFQDYALYPHMTVFNNIAFGLKLRRMPKREISEKVNEVADVLGLAHLLDRKPRALSGGQRQRVALGRAIVRDPKIFLMDEPLSNLDAKLRGQMRLEILKLHQKLQTTFVYVTHDQVEAMTMGTKIVVLRDGVIQQIDAPQKLYERPNNLFVAEFIGNPKINTIDVNPTYDGDKAYIMLGENKIVIPPGKVRKVEDAGEYIAQKDVEDSGMTMTFGLRPEDFHDDEAYIKSSPETVMTVQVNVVENLGSQTMAYFEVGDTDFAAQLHPRSRTRPGDVIKLAIDGNRIHLFDQETEEMIIC